MKIVMYHYVRPENADFPYFRALHIEDFRRQLDHFATSYGFATRERFQKCLTGEIENPNGVVLTFDDGMTDHYDYVFPELAARGLWGIFYISTGHARRGALLDVHRIHCLLGRFGGIEMLERARRHVSPDMLVESHLRTFEKPTYARQTNDEATSEFKKTFNYYLAADHRKRVLGLLMREAFDEAELVRSFYVSPEQLRTMQAAGMVIGAHTVDHPVLSKLSENEQSAEIEGCFETLENWTGGLKERTFCYPYGGSHSFNQTTLEVLSRANCRYAMNVEPRDATADDFLHHPLTLPRYDCNQFPYGQVRL